MPLNRLFLLLACHALADYPLQGEFVSKFKSSQSGSDMWPWILISHGLIHGLFVYLITGNIWFGLAEAFIHCLTDHLKCNGKINFHIDQSLHVFCKVVWAFF